MKNGIAGNIVKEFAETWKDCMVLKYGFRERFYAWLPRRAIERDGTKRLYWLCDLFLDDNGKVYTYICEFPEIKSSDTIKIKRPHKYVAHEDQD